MHNTWTDLHLAGAKLEHVLLLFPFFTGWQGRYRCTASFSCSTVAQPRQGADSSTNIVLEAVDRCEYATKMTR